MHRRIADMRANGYWGPPQVRPLYETTFFAGLRKAGLPGGVMARSAAADFGDQVDFAVGVERGEVGVLVDLAVDRHRHAFVDLVP